MKPEDFKTLIVEPRFAMCRKLLLEEKKEEYCRKNDRGNSFRVAGRILNVSASRALLGMLSKHWASLLDMIDDMDEGRLPEQATVDAKFTDIVNYILLLEGLIYDAKEAHQETEKALRNLGDVLFGVDF
jgi:hypothetical protein